MPARPHATRSLAALRPAALLLAFGLALTPGRALADDPPPPGGAPPAPPGGSPAAPAPADDDPPLPGNAGPGAPGAGAKAEAPDLLAFLGTLERQIARLRVPPNKTATDHALFDWWNTILSPRVGQMAGRIKKISEKHRWQVTPQGRAQHLDPAHWDTVVREVASLYTALDGALQQYRDARVKYSRPTTLGVNDKEAGPPDPDAQARALSNLENSESILAQKVSQGQVVWYEELVWYWNLLSTAELEVQRYERDRERWERQVQAFEDLQARVAYGQSFQQQTLALQMFALRAFVAALQAAEEDRLRKVVATLEPATPGRIAADGFVLDLRNARNAAEVHQNAQASTWGTLLRTKWMTPRKELLDLLEKLDRDAQAAREAAGAVPGGPAPAPGAPGTGLPGSGTPK